MPASWLTIVVLVAACGQRDSGESETKRMERATEAEHAENLARELHEQGCKLERNGHADIIKGANGEVELARQAAADIGDTKARANRGLASVIDVADVQRRVDDGPAALDMLRGAQLLSDADEIACKQGREVDDGAADACKAGIDGAAEVVAAYELRAGRLAADQRQLALIEAKAKRGQPSESDVRIVQGWVTGDENAQKVLDGSRLVLQGWRTRCGAKP